MIKWLKDVRILKILLLSVIIGVFGFSSFYLSKMNRKVDDELVNQQEGEFVTDEELDRELVGETIEPEDVVWPEDNFEDEPILQDNNIINIMLIGQDRRPGESRARSDSMIMATINKKDNTLKLTSFMRDLYVQIPGYGDNRLNASYAFGGMELLDETIASNFRIHIAGNVEVDFDRFIKLVDKIGGIDIAINEQEADYLNIGTSGLNHMDGETALNYSRIRYIGDGDYERTQRQRVVLEATYHKAKKMSLTKILSLIDDTLPLVSTDLSNINIIELASTVMGMGGGKLETYRIPVDGTYKSAVIRNMQVLVPDLEKNRKELKQNLFGVLSE